MRGIHQNKCPKEESCQKSLAFVVVVCMCRVGWGIQLLFIIYDSQAVLTMSIYVRESLTWWRVEELNEMLAGYTAQEQERDDDVERGKKESFFYDYDFPHSVRHHSWAALRFMHRLLFNGSWVRTLPAWLGSLLLSSLGLYMLNMHNICVGVREIVS